MRFDVVTLFPEFVTAVAEVGVTGRASRRGLLELVCWNPRDYTQDVHRTVDDRPYGGGPGMLMKIEPVRAAIQAARDASELPAQVVYLSPQGPTLQQALVEEMSQTSRLILLAGRYEGIDERLLQLEVDAEISLGDYVLSGGELGAMVIIDAVTRLLPGALGHADSAAQDSFTQGLLDCPHYTRPEVYEGFGVPEVLLSGDHARIARWRRQQSLGRTWERRPELMSMAALNETDRELLTDYQRQQPKQARTES